MLELHCYPKDFKSLNFIIAHLEKEESLNNKILATINQCKINANVEKLNSTIIYTTEYKEIQNVAIIQNENLLLAGKANADSISLAIGWLLNKQKQIQKISGSKEVVKLAVSKLLEMDNNMTFELGLETYLMKLTTIKQPSYTKGNFRVAEEKDVDDVSALVKGFLEEALDQHDYKLAQQKTEQFIAQNQLYLLEDANKVVSIAMIGRNLKKTAAISYVYTPVRFRKKGYATNCVYLLSELILKKMNKDCVLFADKYNRQSQKIYQNLGYQTISEFQEISIKQNK